MSLTWLKSSEYSATANEPVAEQISCGQKTPIRETHCRVKKSEFQGILWRINLNIFKVFSKRFALKVCFESFESQVFCVRCEDNRWHFYWNWLERWNVPLRQENKQTKEPVSTGAYGDGCSRTLPWKLSSPAGLNGSSDSLKMHKVTSSLGSTRRRRPSGRGCEGRGQTRTRRSITAGEAGGRSSTAVQPLLQRSRP